MILTSSKEKGQVASILMTKVCESKWKIKIFLGVFLTHLEFHFLSDVALQESTFCICVHRLTQLLCSVPMKILRTNSVFSVIFCSNYQ